MATSSSPTIPDKSANKLWTPDFVFNLLTAHFLFASYTSLFTIIPPYVLDRGGQEWQLGIVVGSFGLVGLLIRPFAGRWTYEFGAKRIVIWGTIVFAIASLLYIPAPNVWMLVPVRILQGIGLAIAPVATSTIVADLAPERRRAEAMSYMGNSISVSNMYAPVLAFWLLGRFGFTSSFLFSAGAGFLGVILAMGMSSAKINAGSARSSVDPNIKIPLIARGAIFPTIIFLSYTLTTAPVNTFLPLLAVERVLGNPGLFFTVFSLTSMLSMLISGTVSDRAGRAAVIVPGLFLTAAAMFMLMAADNRTIFLSAGFLAGAGFGLIQPGMQSLVVDRVPARERSAALATLQQAWDIGGSGGSFLMGPIGGALGIGATFAMVGVGALTGTFGFAIGNTRKRAGDDEVSVEPGDTAGPS
ncbi:MAG: MFS transporter [Chloroflexi bacterium]|nr:MFS transporter [Chloroflexota bacterium]